ncbi:MAG: patatin-like phospholipase family protein [Chitinophagales bacterium]
MKYKILSLDGGGSWALIQARVLLDIYGDIRGHELLREFDMAIGNSGGSLILASLCNDMKLSETISVFENEDLRKQVFSKLTFREKLKPRNILSLFRNVAGIGPKYSTERKLSGLTAVLKQMDHLYADGILSKPIVEMPLNELPAIIKKENFQLLIVGYDYFHERVSFFRSNPNSATNKFNSKYYKVTLAHAIHSSSNAPVNYFDAPAEIKLDQLNGHDNRTSWFWDGGVSGYNNPVLAGLIEAMANNHADPKEYCILSIGTGTGSLVNIADMGTSTDPSIQTIYKKNKDNPLVVPKASFKFMHDVKEMATSILCDPPDSATFITYTILDPSLSNKANLVRINPSLSPLLNDDDLYDLPPAYKIDPDGKNKYTKLLMMDMDAVKNDEVNLITDLCDKFIDPKFPGVPNQLIRGDSKNQPLVLGYSTYQEAKKKWESNCK